MTCVRASIPARWMPAASARGLRRCEPVALASPVRVRRAPHLA
jgi:hypothetical protein